MAENVFRKLYPKAVTATDRNAVRAMRTFRKGSSTTVSSKIFETRVREEWPDQADTILGLIRGKIDPDVYQSVKTWADRCYHSPSKHDRIACALNEVIGTHGVEACFDDGETEPYLEYLNAGDTYDTTLLYFPAAGRWRVGCWGDVVERRTA